MICGILSRTSLHTLIAVPSSLKLAWPETEAGVDTDRCAEAPRLHCASGAHHPTAGESCSHPLAKHGLHRRTQLTKSPLTSTTSTTSGM
jgi:hypothetical protein